MRLLRYKSGGRAEKAEEIMNLLRIVDFLSLFVKANYRAYHFINHFIFYDIEYRVKRVDLFHAIMRFPRKAEEIAE